MDIHSKQVRILCDQSINQFQPIYSPDGKWIAFVSWSDTSGGHLWRVRANGGEPQQLTSIVGQYQRPTWSNDSKFVAVIHGRPILGDRDDPGSGRLELIPVGKGEVRVIADSIPLWNKITFTSDGTGIIYQPKKNTKDEKTGLAVLLASKDLNNNTITNLVVCNSSDLAQQMTISFDNRFLVYERNEDLYLAPILHGIIPFVLNSDKNVQITGIRFTSGTDPYFEKEKGSLCWSYGNHFFKIYPAKIIQTAEQLAIKKSNRGVIESNVFLVAPTKYDQIVTISLSVPSSYGHGIIALKDVKIITMKGNKVIERGTILIKDGRFLAVGSSKQIIIPKGCEQFNLCGKTIIPGLIDVHDHM